MDEIDTMPKLEAVYERTLRKERSRKIVDIVSVIGMWGFVLVAATMVAHEPDAAFADGMFWGLTIALVTYLVAAVIRKLIK